MTTQSEHDFWNDLTLINNTGGNERLEALMAANYCDKYAQRLLESSFPNADKFRGELFGSRGYLHSARAKFDLCFAMGLIGPNQIHNLRLMLRIRNRFAHENDVDSFEHDKIAGLVDNFILPESTFPPEWFGDDGIPPVEEWDRIGRFRHATSDLVRFFFHNAVRIYNEAHAQSSPGTQAGSSVGVLPGLPGADTPAA